MKAEDMSPQQRRIEIAELLGRAMRRMQQLAVNKQHQPEELAQLPIMQMPLATSAGDAHE